MESVAFSVYVSQGSKSLKAGKVIRVNGTTTLWEVLVSVCDVVTAKTDIRYCTRKTAGCSTRRRCKPAY